MTMTILGRNGKTFVAECNGLYGWGINTPGVGWVCQFIYTREQAFKKLYP